MYTGNNYCRLPMYGIPIVHLVYYSLVASMHGLKYEWMDALFKIGSYLNLSPAAIWLYIK